MITVECDLNTDMNVFWRRKVRAVLTDFDLATDLDDQNEVELEDATVSRIQSLHTFHLRSSGTGHADVHGSGRY